jgi:hypothetical protein
LSIVDPKDEAPQTFQSLKDLNPREREDKQKSFNGLRQSNPTKTTHLKEDENVSKTISSNYQA